MKIAVVFTNHLRTLPYTKEILKAFYPANTDYFLCSWSDNHSMLTLTEIKKLMEQHNIGSYIEFVDSKYAFHPLDFKELTEVQGFFNFKRVSTLTMEEFKLWHNKNLFKLFGDSKLYTTSSLSGGLRWGPISRISCFLWWRPQSLLFFYWLASCAYCIYIS